MNPVFFSLAMICTALILLKAVNNYSYTLHLINLSFFCFIKITKNKPNVDSLTDFTAKAKTLYRGPVSSANIVSKRQQCKNTSAASQISAVNQSREQVPNLFQ